MDWLKRIKLPNIDRLCDGHLLSELESIQPRIHQLETLVTGSVGVRTYHVISDESRILRVDIPN